MFDPKSNRTSGYHFFLEPEGSCAEELGGIIAALAREHGGPVFPPHVTLIGSVEDADAPAKAEALARLLTPFTITLGLLGSDDEFFRAFYIAAEKTPSLQEAHDQAKAVFGLEHMRPYTPHLSLFYGNIDTATRELLMRETAYPAGASWEARSFVLYEGEGSAEEWRRVAEYPFGG